MSDEIAAFIAARLDEDEAIARTAADEVAAQMHFDPFGGPRELGNPAVMRPINAARTHMARHDPARVLREVAAKRAILKEHASSGGMYPVCSQCVHREPGTWYGDEEDGEEPPDDESSVSYPCRTVRLLGAVYSTHPDYRAEWKP